VDAGVGPGPGGSGTGGATTTAGPGPGGATGAAANGGGGGSDAGAGAPPRTGPALFPQANSSSSYAITQNGALWSWGVNGSGQLGHTGTGAAAVAALGTSAAAYAGGEIHAIGITTDGKAFTFGVNYSGQLGITAGTGVFGSNPVPQMVAIPTGVTALPWAAAGERYSAFLGSDGNVYIWGGNLFGQQANTTNVGKMTANPTIHAVPRPTGVAGFKFLGGGYSHLFAIAMDDQMWAWGDNQKGQLGIGAIGATPDGLVKAVPTPTGVTGWKLALGGRDFSLAIGSNGTLYAWGANDSGQLGIGTMGGNQPSPTAVALPAGASGWLKVAAGRDHAVAITTEGKLFAWGSGSGTTPAEVAPPAGVSGWSDVSAGVSLILAVGSDGKIYQWMTGAKPGAPMAGLP
jgi:alpha-tubulin suppressor-like RCC1 family protein